MNTFKHFHNISTGFSQIKNGMNGLESEFKYVAPSTDLDKSHIDIMITFAQNMIIAAEALKSVTFEGPPDDGVA